MNTLQIVSLIVATAALFGWISSRVLRLPITIGSMALTVLTSVGLLSVGGCAPGIHRWALDLAQQVDFEGLVLHWMLPLLLFAGAFLLDLGGLAREKLPVAVLSTLGTVMAFFAVAGLMKLIGGVHASWTECFLFGALISPTDPIAVLELLRRLGIPKSIESQLAGESLFNDGVGAVLFITMLAIARGSAPTPLHVLGLLTVQAGGAILLGFVAAWLISHLMCLVNSYRVDILLTLSLAFGGYVLAEQWHLSAPLEAVVAGISLRRFNRTKPDGRIADDRVDEFWTLIDEVQNSLLFVLLGLEVLAVALNAATVRAGLSAIVSVNLVRLAVVTLCVGMVHLIQKQSRATIVTLTWGGLRGGLSIALALSVPATLGAPWILGATYMVVVTSIILQGGSLQWALMRWQRKKAAVARTA